MKIYLFNIFSGEYLGEGIAELDQLDNSRYLIPAYATTIEPFKFKKNYIVCFDTQTNKWVYKKINN